MKQQIEVGGYMGDLEIAIKKNGACIIVVQWIVVVRWLLVYLRYLVIYIYGV